MTRVVMASPAVRDPNRAKALRILGDGRLTVLAAWTKAASLDLAHAEIMVLSSRPGAGRYAVDFDDDPPLHPRTWTCTCGKPGCAHIRAAQLVLGHGVLPS